MKAYSNFHPLPSNEFHTTHDVFLHFHQLRELLGQIWAKRSRGRFAKGMTRTA